MRAGGSVEGAAGQVRDQRWTSVLREGCEDGLLGVPSFGDSGHALPDPQAQLGVSSPCLLGGCHVIETATRVRGNEPRVYFP